jgi:hypothetical protein
MNETVVTVAALKRALLLDATPLADDARLLDAIRAATSDLERLTARQFAPHTETRVYRPEKPAVDLVIAHDLLEITAISDEIGGIALLGLEQIIVDGRIVRVLFKDGRTFAGKVTINGVWGYHTQPPLMWYTSADEVRNTPNLSASATVITVNDADGADTFGETPRFSAGQLIRVGNEIMQVNAVNTGANTLSVTRGVCGTLATTASTLSAISTFVAPLDVRSAIVRLAGVLLRGGVLTADDPFIAQMRRVSV